MYRLRWFGRVVIAVVCFSIVFVAGSRYFGKEKLTFVDQLAVVNGQPIVLHQGIAYCYEDSGQWEIMKQKDIVYDGGDIVYIDATGSRCAGLTKDGEVFKKDL